MPVLSPEPARPASPPPAPGHVSILLATFNGARWLPAQLESLARQSHVDWSLWVGDDGSGDDTRRIVADFAAGAGRGHEVRLVEGPRQGAAQNFLALLTHPDLPAGPGRFAALCDQDDVWLPGKLARALDRLGQKDAARPVIYGAQSLHIDEEGRPVGRSRRPRGPVSLGNAVVQNMVSGHSCVLNPAALALAREAGRHPGIAFQDWWLSLLVLAAGGEALIDEETVLLYRQHGQNVLGAPVGLGALLHRIGLLFGHDYARWIAGNLAALRASPVDLTPEARAVLDGLSGPAQPGLARLRALRRLGVHRQSGLGTALLWLGAVLGRV
ncbi:glycosyltransferase [Neotabrizicola shimadae]|uniref:Glycosyltransferase n=1 Tax=Neotabrizicola shimadae TaxID=2807096 RepID=A0A8G0ZVV6_9RHOB|nr:glycosyltransferase [Neotabrizicola shimadae]QYZ72256.1 glycosyltransferase [Neotabrizicola shimadae]